MYLAFAFEGASRGVISSRLHFARKGGFSVTTEFYREFSLSVV